jgi:hypothetical protein
MKFPKIPNFLGQPWYVFVAGLIAVWYVAKSLSTVRTVAAQSSVPPSVGGVDAVFGTNPTVPKSRPKTSSVAMPGEQHAVNWVEKYPPGNGVLR